MPWYYAGPEAKPVGPVSLEELHAQRLRGAISPETYVIESGGAVTDTKEWKRYREIFPTSPTLPAAFVPSTPLLQPPLPLGQPPVSQPHPLFPSAGGVLPLPGQMPLSSQPPLPPAVPRLAGTTNNWCRWGFGLSVSSVILLLVTCGFGGWLMALPGLIISFVGLMQLHKHREQSGQGLAIIGMIISSFVLVLTLILLAVAVPYFMKQHDQTATEESTNDSQ